MKPHKSLATNSYKGVRDFYPKDWSRLQSVFTRTREILGQFGYEEYNASPIERAELYESKTSEEIVNEQTYTFTDRGERRVTLRPEMTPTLARMIANKRRELVLPVRWFSISNVFRYERPQRGRLREHYQLNVDLVGAASHINADKEIISLTSIILRSFGASNDDFVIRINDRELLLTACTLAGLTDEQKKSYIHLLDKKNKMSEEDFTNAKNAITDTDPLAFIEANTDSNIVKIKERLQLYKKQLADAGIPNVEIDITLTRGFDYYTGIVFEVFDTDTNNARSLFGGGRYDNLMSLFGKDTINAVGFGMGDVVLMDFLETHNLLLPYKNAPTIFIGIAPHTELNDVQVIAKKLRDDGLRVFVNLSEKSLGDQVREAVRREIPYFTAVGTDEINSKTLKVKRLSTGEEKELQFDAVAAFCII